MPISKKTGCTVLALFFFLFSSIFFSCGNPFMQQLLERKTASFNSNGGSTVASQTLFKGEKINRPTDPVRTDFIFEGWFRDNNSFLSQWDFNLVPAKDITLYAKWQDIASYGISLSPSEFIDFGSSVIGYKDHESVRVTVTNTGIFSIDNLTVTLSGADRESFLLVPNVLSGIPVRGSTSFTVAPKTGLDRGNYTATVTVSGDNKISSSLNLIFSVDMTSITDVAISITAPATGAVPVTVANTGGNVNFTIGAVSWIPGDSIFKDDMKYTAAVTLTVKDGYTFSGLVTATINGNPALVLDRTGETVTLSLSFPATAPASGVTFDITEIIDPNIALEIPPNLKISRSGVGALQTATIMVQNSASYDIEWRYAEHTLQIGAVLTLGVTDNQADGNYFNAYNTVGIHILTVIVEIDGIPYSKLIEFEVLP